MKKVYQQELYDLDGDCMRAVIASLLELPIEKVPNFIKYKGKWFSKLEKFMKKKGYKLKNTIHNATFMSRFYNLSINNGKNFSGTGNYIISKENLKKLNGINGLFYGVVLSPAHFNPKDTVPKTHAVIVDQDLNIVHDPNPLYKKIERYPLNDLLGNNGITCIYNFEKK